MPVLSIFDGHAHSFDCPTCHTHDCPQCRNWHWCNSMECGNIHQDEREFPDDVEFRRGDEELCPSCAAPLVHRFNEALGRDREQSSHPCARGHFCDNCDGAWWHQGECVRGRGEAIRCFFCREQARQGGTTNSRGTCRCNGCAERY